MVNDALKVRYDFQRVFDTGYFTLLPNLELLKTIYNEVVAHRQLPYSRRPKWTEVRLILSPIPPYFSNL